MPLISNSTIKLVKVSSLTDRPTVGTAEYVIYCVDNGVDPKTFWIWRNSTWEEIYTTITDEYIITRPLTGLVVTGGTITSTDTILSAFGKLQNQLNAVASPMIYQGVWNANTNQPPLVSSVGTKGYVYRVTTSGSTNIDGVTDWKSGDFIVFNGTTWDKWDTTDAVTSVNGYTGNVVLVKADVGLGNVPNIDATNPANIVQNTNFRFVTDVEKTYWNGKQDALGYIPEDVANKATTMTGNTTSNVKYLTSKAVYDWGTSTFIPLNVPIVGATKTKITYDSKGLVTAGADATTADIADSLNKRYVTDANLVVINNTSNTNTGDETQSSIKTKLGEASATQDGYLSAFYWSTFNNKQSAISLTNFGNSGAASFISNTLNIPVYTLAGLGGVSTSRNINTTAPLQGGGDLSADRTLTITQATAGSSGYLSSADWNKFNDKQNALSGGITNRVTKWTSSTDLGNSQIFDDGTNVGINITSPLTKFHVRSTAVAATNETIARFDVSDDTSSYFRILNAYTQDAVFGPSIEGKNSSTYTGLYVIGNGTTDTGSNPLMIFDARMGSSAVSTRPLFQWSNYNTAVMTMIASGNLGLGTAAPGAKLDINGNLKVQTIANATIDTDRFLVSDSGIIKYRTGAELLSDIGGQGAIVLTTTGNSGAATLTSGTLNVPTYTLAGLGGEPTITAGTTSQYWRGDKTWQTLNTTAVVEGTNLYFTEGRVRSTLLTGLSVSGGTIAATDSVLIAFGKIQNQLNAVTSPMIYQGTWNANTNTPALTSGIGTKGYVYRVTTSGSTDIDGTTDWKSGDFIVFNGTTWDKWDSTDAVTSVNGYTGAVVLTKSDVGLSNVENTALSTWPGSVNITTLGTITTGVWQGTAIADAYITSAATWNAKVGGTGTTNYLPLWSNSTTLATSNVYQDPITSNIGIGTSTPTVNLHIARSTTENFYINLANSSGPLGETTTTDTTKRPRLIASNSGSSVSIGQIGFTNTTGTSFGSQGDSYLSSSATANSLNIIKQPGGGSTTDNIKFFAGNLATAIPSLSILGSGVNKGNVGINVANPSAALEIAASSEYGILLYNQVDNASKIEITSSQVSQNYISFVHNATAPLDTIINTTSSNGTATTALFRVQTYGTDALIIDDNQNVAIGTIPSAKFHINNTTSFNSFLVEDSFNPDTTPFVIDSAGNVGIGITTPSTKLHISSTTSGAFRLVDTTQGAGKYLRSNANGVGTWSNLDIPSLGAVLDVGNNTDNQSIIFNAPSGLQDLSGRSNIRFDTPDQVTITNTNSFVGGNAKSVVLVNSSNAEASVTAERVLTGVSAKRSISYVCDSYSDTSVEFVDNISNAYLTNLRITQSTMLIGSTLNSSLIDPNFRGAEYLHNYASNYTNRSLVDKEYVDTAVSTVTVGTTASVSHTVKAGVALTKGQAVYVSSANGTNMIVSKADYSTEGTSSKTMGLIAQDLAINGIGQVITEGLLAGLDTSTAGSEGDAVWLGDDGNLLYGLANKPVAPNHMVFIGIVTRKNNINGEIFIKVQNGFELDELHNIQITGAPHNNEILTYDATTSLWKPSFIPPIGANEVFRGRTFRFDSTTVDTYGGIATLNNASSSAIVPNTTLFGNRFTRVRYYASIVSTGRVTSIRSVDLQWFLSGGFRFQSTYRVADTTFSSNCQTFHGLIGSIAEIPIGGAGLIQASTLTNCIFVGNEGADTNLQVFHNDATGTCTKIDLGVNFPANRTAGSEMTTMYSIEIYNQVGTTDVKYRVINLESGAKAQGIITTNLPAITQGLAIQSARVMGTPTTNTGQWEQHKWGCSDITV
jgi:hypothetical protein